MTALADAQIDRYSRQIIMPEVGGRGQERLLAARVALAGDAELVGIVAALCARAGVGALAVPGDVVVEPWPDCTVARHDGTAPGDADVLVALGDAPGWGVAAAARPRPLVSAQIAGPRVAVVTLAGRPCVACVVAEPTPPATDDDTLAAPAALVAAGLVAHAVVRLVVDPPARGRRETLDLATGLVASAPLDGPGCARCGPST